MKPNDRVKIISPIFESMFEVGSEHIVQKVDEDLIYLVDPFYTDHADKVEYGLWPFMEDELEALYE